MTRKLIIILLIGFVGITTVVPAGLVLAQAVVPTSDANAHVQLQNANGTLDDVSNVLGKTPAETRGVIEPDKTIAQIRVEQGECAPVINNVGGQGVDSYIQSLKTVTDFGAIGGGAAESTVIKAQITALENTTIPCVNRYIKALTDEGSVNLRVATYLAREQQTFSTILGELNDRLTQLKARASATWKDILKAAATKIFISQVTNMSQEMINKLSEKYKITDYLAYGNALATQVYNIKYINENFQGDTRQKMMIRSILESDHLPSQIYTAQAIATQQANEYLAQACNPSQQSQDLGGFIKCMSAWGSEGANESWRMNKAVDQSIAATAAGKAMSAAEISQSNGYAPSRNCAGSLSQQQQIDEAFKQASIEVKVTEAAYKRLSDAYALDPSSTTPEEVAKAAAARDQAIANSQALEKQTNNPLIDICDAIDSPAHFISDSITSFLDKHLNQATDLKSDNLPFSIDFLTNVANNFITNLLTGGKSKSQVLKEAGIGALNGGIIAAQQATTKNGVPITGTSINNSKVNINAFELNGTTPVTTLVPGKTYLLVADYSAAGLHPQYVIVEGFGGGRQRIDLSAAEINSKEFRNEFTVDLKSPISLTISLTFYDDPNTPSAIYPMTFRISTVAGASTSVPYEAIMPRGPQISLR